MANTSTDTQAAARADLASPAPAGDAPFSEARRAVGKWLNERPDTVPVRAIAELCAAFDRLTARPAGDAGALAAEGQPYGIVDPDYARVFTQARIIAWQYGYACVMHGSFTRDLDLLLVPWQETARANGEQLLKLIAQACGLRFRDGQEDIIKATADFTDKPHGRRSCSLYFPGFGDRRWVDISIMPVRQADTGSTT